MASEFVWTSGIEIAEAFPTAAAVRKEIDHLSVGANNIDLGRTDGYTSVISPAPVAEDSVLAIVMTGNGQRFCHTVVKSVNFSSPQVMIVAD